MIPCSLIEETRAKWPDKITTKGYAFLAAIDSGLIPKKEDMYDDALFERFWSYFQDNLERRKDAN